VGTANIVSAGGRALGWSLVRCIQTVRVVVTGQVKVYTLTRVAVILVWLARLLYLSINFETTISFITSVRAVIGMVT